MQRKNFKSLLFKKNIKADNLDYWFFLYAETLYRLKLNEELSCTCSECRAEKTRYNYILDHIEEEGYIPPIRRKNKLSGKGDCGRTLGPVA